LQRSVDYEDAGDDFFVGVRATDDGVKAAATSAEDWRHISTRYDRCGRTFFSAICIAAFVIYGL